MFALFHVHCDPSNKGKLPDWHLVLCHVNAVCPAHDWYLKVTKEGRWCLDERGFLPFLW